MRFARLSIRARITGGSLLVAALISLIAGIVIYNQVERIVTDGQVTVLQTIEAPYLAALAADPNQQLDPPGRQLVAVVNPGLTAVVNTLVPGLSAQLPSLLRDPGTTRNIQFGENNYLVRVSPVVTNNGTWFVVSAIRIDVETDVLNQVAMLLIGSIAGINLAFAAASWFIGSAVLRPVARLRRSAAALVRQPGSELLPVGPARDEIAQLAVTLNELISQLRASAERERQIVSDASHEFRTPLAIMQTQLELARAEASSLEQMHSDIDAVQRTLARLSALATSMLELSRIDAQSSPGSATFSELSAELEDAADRGRRRVGSRDIRIDYFTATVEDDPRVAVSVPDFGRACDNLVGNALAATEGAGAVTLSLGLADRQAVLIVSDEAGGMDEAFVPLALDRFSRGDSARRGGGAGLGLPIVAGIAAVSGGSVELVNRPGIGLSVEVSFPLVAP